jgi:hypothetical protein
MLVVKVPSMATLWKGRAQLVVTGAAELIADEDNHQLYSIGAGGAVSHVRELEEDETHDKLREVRNDEDRTALERVEKGSCHVAGWVFPAEACVR